MSAAAAAARREAHQADAAEQLPRPTTGEELAATIREELTGALTGDAAPYNLVFTTNGIASTTASAVPLVMTRTMSEPATKRVRGVVVPPPR